MKELTRRDLLRRTGALAAGLAGSGLVAPGAGRLVAARQESAQLNLWKAPHSPDDQQY